jgi:alkyldihydroxyacetonephosphate synthase
MSESPVARLLEVAEDTLLESLRKVGSAIGVPRRTVAQGDTRFTPPVAAPDGSEEALDGWGFKDTRFVVKPNGSVVLTGDRYNISNVELPELMPWMAKMLAAPLGYANKNPPHYPPAVPASRVNPALKEALLGFLREDQLTDDALIRLRHGHGHAGAEIWAIRYTQLERVPDLVVYPQSHDEVVRLTELAAKHGACLIPFGGGTNVTEALKLSKSEERTVVAVDMRRMNQILWVDAVNRTACIEAGATGRHIFAELKKLGLTMGHEPDSVEFSTLGGWVATNASGMKKNRYGNIEDVVLDVKAVTAQGVVERPGVGPRESVGLNPKNLMFGSEGNLGIITQAIVKVFPLPEVQKYGSVLFPSLEEGLAFLYELQRAGAVPASVRVMDNTQFHFGQALKPAHKGLKAKLKSQAEKLYVTRLLRFDPMKMAVATIVYEGSAEEVRFQEKVLKEIASRHGGLDAGPTNGERGYQLTFGIAYIRDLTFEHHAIAESFETSVPWSQALSLYERVKRRVQDEHEKRGLPGKPFFTGRITQVYSTGVAMYFYLGFYTKGVEDPVKQYSELEHAAREEILAAGGTLSHHHGIGKLRESFVQEIYSPGALAVTREVKKAVDPKNLFGAGNHGVNAPAKAASSKRKAVAS